MKERVMGMVLSAATIGEYDKRIVLLTRERGRISAFVRGVRRPKSPLSASTEPFTFGEFFIYRGRDSYTVEQTEVKNYFPELRQNLDSLYMALYFCEIADYFSREGMDATDELNLLYLSLRALSVPDIPNRLIRYIYEFKMLAIEGEAPRMFQCMNCGGIRDLHHFYIGQAGILCEDCRRNGNLSLSSQGMTLSETTVYTMQRILSSPIEKLYSFTVSESILNELADAVHVYFCSHTDRPFKSLSMLDLL